MSISFLPSFLYCVEFFLLNIVFLFVCLFKEVKFQPALGTRMSITQSLNTPRCWKEHNLMSQKGGEVNCRGQALVSTKPQASCRQKSRNLSLPSRDFPGSPVVKTLHFQCRGCRFDPWSEKIPHAVCCSRRK